MTIHSALRLCAIFLFVPLPLAAQGPQAGARMIDTIWKGRTGSGMEVVWSTDNIVATMSGKPVYDLRTVQLLQFMREYRELSRSLPDADNCSFHRTAALLAVTDHFLGMRQLDSVRCKGTSYSSIESRLITYDLRDGGHVVSLGELFSSSDIRDALLGDRLVRKALAEEGIAKFTGTLDELLLRLAKFTGSCEYRFPADLLSRFVLYEQVGRKVTVRLGVPGGCDSAGGSMTEVSLQLPVSAALAVELRTTSKGAPGYPMRAAERIDGRRVTSIPLAMTSR